jgi:hypothetical protein
VGYGEAKQVRLINAQEAKALQDAEARPNPGNSEIRVPRLVFEGKDPMYEVVTPAYNLERLLQAIAYGDSRAYPKGMCLRVSSIGLIGSGAQYLFLFYGYKPPGYDMSQLVFIT